MQTNIENLVLEGGAIKGLAYIGAIHALFELGILCNIKRFAGTSIGALFAFLLAAGYSSDDIQHCLNFFDFKSISTKSSLLYCFYQIWKHEGYGIQSMNTIFEALIKALEYKGIDKNITLSDLYELTGKDLVIVTTNLNIERGVYFHWKTFPDVKVIDAIMCSMRVPFLFRSEKKDYMYYSDYYVDGGLVDNYPIWVFNDIEALYAGTLERVEKETIPTTTLGLKLLVPGEDNNFDIIIERKSIDSLTQYIEQMINTMLIQMSRLIVSESCIKQTIPIKLPAISFSDFDLSEDERKKIIDKGYMSVRDYFSCIRVL